jgi:hypothetical protein
MSFGEAMNRLYTDPGTSPGELEGIAPAVVNLGNVAFTLGEIWPPGLRVDFTASYCTCPTCRGLRCEPVPPDSSGEAASGPVYLDSLHGPAFPPERSGGYSAPVHGASGLEVLRTAPGQPDPASSPLPDGAYWIES